MAQPYLSIIIPAYNEAERLPKTLVDMDKRLENAPYSYEILVVDDGSKDNTLEVARSMAKMVRNLKAIEIGDNGGKGATVRKGMLLASGKVRLFTDADNSTSIDQFDQMIPFFKEDYDVVIGSRTAKGAKLDPPEPFYRQLAGKGLNLLVQALLLPGIWDTQCGFKAFTEESAKKIFEFSRLSGWGFDFETLSLAKKMGYKIKEVPVHWVNDAKSHVGFSAGLQFLRDLVKIRSWLWQDAYGLGASAAKKEQKI